MPITLTADERDPSELIQLREKRTPVHHLESTENGRFSILAECRRNRQTQTKPRQNHLNTSHTISHSRAIVAEEAILQRWHAMAGAPSRNGNESAQGLGFCFVYGLSPKNRCYQRRPNGMLKPARHQPPHRRQPAGNTSCNHEASVPAQTLCKTLMQNAQQKATIKAVRVNNRWADIEVWLVDHADKDTPAA